MTFGLDKGTENPYESSRFSYFLAISLFPQTAPNQSWLLLGRILGSLIIAGRSILQFLFRFTNYQGRFRYGTSNKPLEIAKTSGFAGGFGYVVTSLLRKNNC